MKRPPHRTLFDPPVPPPRPPVRDYHEPAEAAARAAGAEWKDRAIDALRAFIATIGDSDFINEDVVAWADKERGLPAPPDGRAWGAVISSARRSGLIRATGRFLYGKSASPKTVWKRV